ITQTLSRTRTERAMAPEERHKPDVLKQYESSGIRVNWEPKLCIHVSNCVRALPHVFDANARPWVKVDAASADEIAAAIEGCPTGALSFVRKDGAPQETPESPTKVEPRPNGPLFVRGDIEVIDSAGNVVGGATRVALVRRGTLR